MAQVIAVIKYQLKPDSASPFLSLINGEDFINTVKNYTGFVSYNLVNTEGDFWCEYIIWESMEAATNGSKLFQTAPANIALQPYLVLTSFDVSFLEIAAGFHFL